MVLLPFENTSILDRPWKKQQKFADKIKSYDKALELDPNNFEAWSEKARCLLASKGNSEALAAFNSALEIEPKNVFVLLEKASLLKKMGTVDDSLKIYDYILGFEPENPIAKRAKNFATVFNQKGICQACGIEIAHQNSCPFCHKTLCWECLDTRFHECEKESIPNKGSKPGVSITYHQNGKIEARK